MIFFPPVSLFFPSEAMHYFHRRCTGGKYSFPVCQCFSPVSLFFPLAMPLPSFLDSFLDMSLRRTI
jgi:hypothetical protein